MTHAPMHIDELVEHWTILDEERELVAGKRGATRLGFAILLKFYTQYGRFPRGRWELAEEVIEHVAKQVQVPASELGFYEWSGSTIEYHRNQIRTHLGFRTCSTADAAKVTVWLTENVAHAERRPGRVREELFKHLREERIEPPTPGRVARIVASALHNAEVTGPCGYPLGSPPRRRSASTPWSASTMKTMRHRRMPLTKPRSRRTTAPTCSRSSSLPRAM